MENPPLDRVALQRTWSDHQMAANVNWNLFKSTHLMFAHEGMTFVLYQITNGAPHLLDLLRVDEVGVSFSAGLAVTFASAQTGNRYTANGLEREVLPGIFLWTPAFAEVRFAPMKYDLPGASRRLSVPLCAKMRSRFDTPREGHRYIATMKEFCHSWPNII